MNVESSIHVASRVLKLIYAPPFLVRALAMDPSRQQMHHHLARALMHVNYKLTTKLAHHGRQLAKECVAQLKAVVLVGGG